MNRYSNYTLFITVCIIISAWASSPSKSSATGDRTCPEQYRELRLRDTEANLEIGDDDDEGTYQDESRESQCEQAMDLIIEQRRIEQLNPLVLLFYCPHYGERLALAQKDNVTCEEKKQELIMKRKRQELKKKDDGDSSTDSEDDHGKRWKLHRRELSKRFASRFLRKRML